MGALDSGAELGECVSVLEGELGKRPLPGDIRRQDMKVTKTHLFTSSVEVVLGKGLAITLSEVTRRLSRRRKYWPGQAIRKIYLLRRSRMPPHLYQERGIQHIRAGEAVTWYQVLVVKRIPSASILSLSQQYCEECYSQSITSRRVTSRHVTWNDVTTSGAWASCRQR